jgi:hypothetical protein
MFFTPLAILAKLKPVRRCLLVLHGSVIFSLADRARYRDNFSHDLSLHNYMQQLIKDETSPLPECLEKLKGIFSQTKGYFTTRG